MNPDKTVCTVHIHQPGSSSRNKKSLAPSQPYADGDPAIWLKDLACSTCRGTHFQHTWTRARHDSKEAAAQGKEDQTRPNHVPLFFSFFRPGSERNPQWSSPPARPPLANRMAGVIYRSTHYTLALARPSPQVPVRDWALATHGFLSALQKDTFGRGGERAGGPGSGTRRQAFWTPLGNSQGQGGGLTRAQLGGDFTQ